jgi:DNA-binding ferritin-like protein (Dps family)
VVSRLGLSKNGVESLPHEFIPRVPEVSQFIWQFGATDVEQTLAQKSARDV